MMISDTALENLLSDFCHQQLNSECSVKKPCINASSALQLVSAYQTSDFCR